MKQLILFVLLLFVIKSNGQDTLLLREFKPDVGCIYIQDTCTLIDSIDLPVIRVYTNRIDVCTLSEVKSYSYSTIDDSYKYASLLIFYTDQNVTFRISSTYEGLINYITWLDGSIRYYFNSLF
jgi:hypothetical protein